MSSNEMGWLEQARKLREAEKKTTTNSTSSSGNSGQTSSGGNWLERARQLRYEEDAKNVDDSYIDIFMTEANKYRSSAQSEYEKMSWSNASDVASSRRKAQEGLDHKYNVISRWLENNRSKLSEDRYRSVYDMLDTYSRDSKAILDSFDKAEKYYSQWETEEDYNTAVRYDGYSQKYKGANAEDIQKALDTVGMGEERDWLQYYQGDIVGDSIRSSDDFQKYSSQGNTLEYTDFGTETWHRGKSRRQRGYNSIDKYRAASLALSEHYGNEAPLGSQGQYDEQVAIFRTMDDKEFENLAYYIAYDKEYGTSLAERYVDLMEETLSQRRGIDIGEKVTSIDVPIIEDLAVLGYGALSGIDSFAFGIEQSMSDEELAHYPSTYANAHISDSLDGFGYYAHSAATTIGNMAPSILLSAALSGLGVPGKVAEGVGSATLGVSAAGNAYKDALSKGYDKDSARNYSNLVGASEGVLQYLIGGVTKLGGMSGKVAGKISAIDNALLRGSAKLGVNLVSEITEEEVQNYLEPAFRTIIFGEDYDAPTINELIETAIVTMLSTGALEARGVIRETRAESALNKNAMKEYGDKTDALIQEGLESDQNSDSYKLAQKYQEQVQGKDGKGGKALTGTQIRNLVDANNEQATVKHFNEVRSEAKNQLKELGEKNTQLWPLAELVAKRVTGQELTRKEISTLARSEFGAKVAKDMLDAAKKAEQESKTAYKPITERIGEEGNFNVSDSGQATIRESGDAFDFANAEVATVGEGQMTFKTADGTEVYAGDIDFADDNQSFLVSAVSEIENITPAAASAVMHDIVDTAKPLGEQINGIDEAYTYGFHGYSVEDMKSGNFTSNLTEEQMMSAYRLGQSARKISGQTAAEGYKKMRTAVQAATEKAVAEGKEAPKGKKLTITYNHGGGVIEDIATTENKLGELNEEQRAGIEAAKILHQMGIGTDYEFFTSYNSKTLKDKNGNPLEVFLNDEGQEQAAYAGVYVAANGKIRINLNAYSGTKGLTLNALSHELGHFIKTWSLDKYTAMAELLAKSYGGKSMHELVLKEQSRLEGIRGEDVSYDEAYDEVVANAFNRMLEDGKVMERIAEIRQVDKSLGDKIIEGIRKFINRFFKAYQNNKSLFMETEALMEMKEVFEQLQNMFAEALVDASDNFQASLIAKEAGLEVMPVEAVTQYSYSSLAEAAGFAAVENADGTRSFVRDGKAVSEVTVEDIENSPIGAFINFSVEMEDITEEDAKRQKEMFAKICTMACKTNDFAMTMQFVGSAVFTGMKANADKQYGTTYDFPSICTKTQAVIDAMSAKMVSLGRGLTTDEIVKLYDDVFASGNPVPCPECYVFSRWIGIGGLLDNIKKYQDYYGDMDVKDVADAYLKMKAEVSKFADEQGISFGKAKGALTSKLTKEYNKLTEKIEKAENQGEKVKPADRQRLAELEPMMNTVKAMTWLENVYFADSSLKKVNPKFRVPNEVLFDLNNGEAFASQYKDAWAFRTTQGVGYGKAITPYAEARLGEGVLVTNNTTNAIKGRAQGTLNNYFINQKGKLDKQSRDALKRARQKQKIQAFIGGQRFQSTSDARYENASDYLLAALEMQAMAGMVQCYTKVDGAVPAFSAWGFSINQSLMPLNGGLDANGKVKDTAVGGMKPSVAFDNRNKHETAGTITIGVNDNHIREMFKQWERDFIIPYHASGGKADVVAEFRRIQEGNEAKGKAVRSTDYSRTQSDKVLSDDVLRWQGKTDAQIQRIHEIRNARIAILTGGKVNMTVVRSNRFLSALYDKLNGGEWDGVKLAKSKVESQIFPNEFWDQTVSYEDSAKITQDYLEYCNDLGFLHRFSGTVPSNGRLVAVNGYNENGERVQLTDLAYKYDENGNMTDEVEPFFWKVLTDRRMYDNNGNYLPQKVVTLNDTTTETVTEFAKNNQGRQYDKAKAEALAKKIVDNATPNSENSVKQKGGNGNDNRRIREVSSENAGSRDTYGERKASDGGRNSSNAENAQAYKKWGDQAAATRKRLVERVDRYIGESKNYDEIFDYLCSIAGATDADITVRQLKKAITQIAEELYTSATTMHPVLFEDRWSMFGDTVSNLRKDILATAQANNTGKQYSSQQTDFDSDGNELSEEQVEFFAKAETRDENGNLVMLYHTSPTAGFYTFEGEKGEGNYKYKNGEGVEVTFFTDSKEMSSSYAENPVLVDTSRDKAPNSRTDAFSGMYKGYANITKPYVVDVKGGEWNQIPWFNQQKYDAFTSVTEQERNAVMNLYEETGRGLSSDYHQFAFNDKLEEILDKQSSQRSIFSKEKLSDNEKLIASALKKVNEENGYGGELNLWLLSQNGFNDAEIRKMSEKSVTTNFVVKQALETGDHDGVIIKNVKDYGTHIGDAARSTLPAHNVYVTFHSDQFKAWDNRTPTKSKDMRYSTQETDNITNRHLLANAFEMAVQNSSEYEMLQDYKDHIKQLNELEAKLSGLNHEIRKIRFGTEGARDTEKLKELEDEAKKVAKEINRYDKRLVNMEASEPLRKVIDRERKKAAQKTREHVKEIQQNKKVRAEQTELRHKIRKTVRDLDKILNRGNKKQNVKEDMQPVVSKALKAAEILFTDNYGTYDMLRNGIGADMSESEEALVNTCAQMLKDIDNMPSDGYDSWQARQAAENRLNTKMSKLKDVFARERRRLSNTKVSTILGELADAYASLEDSEQSYVQGAYTEAVHNFLKSLQSEVGGAIVTDMTKSQLESVYAAYQMVLNTVRNANKMFNESLKQSREQLGNAVIQEVITAGGTHGLWTKGEIARSQASWNNTKPVWVANRIGSDTFSKLMDGLFKGQYGFAVDVDEAKQFKLSMDEKYHPRNWDSKKLYSFESSTGRKFDLNLQQIMSLYAFSKRKQAYSHLLNGGFVFEANSTVVVDKNGIKRTYLYDDATSYKLNEATLNEIINSLTAEQKAYVDEMQAYLSDVMGAKGNEVSMKLYGIQMFKEKFYFPLRSSGAYMERAKEAEMKKQQGQINLVNSGFTHAVKPEAKNSIILSDFMDVWAEHCNEMSMYHSMVLPMEDLRKVYNYSTVPDENTDVAGVYAAIKNAYGKAATDYIDQLYRELNAGATVDPRETPSKARISKFKKAAVMQSASVVVQQFSAIGRAFAIIDPNHFIGAKVKSTDMSTSDEMKKYAPVAIIKEMGGFDTGTKGSAKNYIMAEKYGRGDGFFGMLKDNRHGKFERIKGLVKDEQYRGDIMGYFPAKADEITWCSIWEAAKRETRAMNPKLDVKSEEFLKKAGELFSETVEKTQVYDSVLARSANMRSKGALMSMATAFMAEPTATVNLLEDAVRSGKAKNIARAFGSVAVSILLNNALASIVYAMRDDDEDETFVEKYFQSVAAGLIDDINPMTYYPFLKDVNSLFQGYDVERADMSVIADLRDALKRAVSVMGEDPSEMSEEELVAHWKKVNEIIMSGMDAGFSAFGVPEKNVRRDVFGIINACKTIHKDVTQRDTTWMSFWDKVGAAAKDTVPIYSWTKDRTKQDKLYEAIIGGDTQYVTRMKDGYKTDESYHNAIRKALRENDPRIREAAIAWNGNDLDEYMRIAKQIIGEKHFVQDDVVMAIRSEASKLAPDEGETSTSKAKGLFTVEKFAEAAVQGDMATAKAAKTDIIQTARANGKTSDEAEKSFVSSAKTELKKSYLAGSLIQTKAINALTSYCGDTQEEAEKRLGEWGFEKKYGFSYADRGDAYKSGAISASELQSILVNVGGKTEEDAMWQVKVYDWQKEGIDIDSDQRSVVEDYETFCEPARIDKHTYYDAYLFYKDSGEEGVKNSKVLETMPYIGKLPLKPAQKTALAKCWWADSTINRYKTW